MLYFERGSEISCMQMWNYIDLKVIENHKQKAWKNILLIWKSANPISGDSFHAC